MSEPSFDTLTESRLSLELVHRGKVRDLWRVDDDHLLVVATDRVSAFDVILPTPIPGKGVVLTELTRFWCRLFRDRIPGQLTDIDPADVLVPAEADQVRGRALVVRRLQPLPVEAIVRGYLSGSGWAAYRDAGSVCGEDLPAGLLESDQLPTPLFTPSTKAAVGEHDENISLARMADLVGAARAAEVRDAAIALYTAGAEHARQRGILIADTKFEFGLDADGRLHLIDEVLTPDSSRFWPADAWRPGGPQASFDKQYIRDWLTASGWSRQPPAPGLPVEVVEATVRRYAEVRGRLMT